MTEFLSEHLQQIRTLTVFSPLLLYGGKYDAGLWAAVMEQVLTSYSGHNLEELWSTITRWWQISGYMLREKRKRRGYYVKWVTYQAGAGYKWPASKIQCHERSGGGGLKFSFCHVISGILWHTRMSLINYYTGIGRNTLDSKMMQKWVKMLFTSKIILLFLSFLFFSFLFFH